MNSTEFDHADLQFEPYWDDRWQKWRVSVFGFEKEAVNLPSAFRIASDHPLRKAALAAMDATPFDRGDKNGLYWMTKGAAQKAARAAKKVCR